MQSTQSSLSVHRLQHCSGTFQKTDESFSVCYDRPVHASSAPVFLSKETVLQKVAWPNYRHGFLWEHVFSNNSNQFPSLQHTCCTCLTLKHQMQVAGHHSDFVWVPLRLRLSWKLSFYHPGLVQTRKWISHIDVFHRTYSFTWET